MSALATVLSPGAQVQLTFDLPDAAPLGGLITAVELSFTAGVRYRVAWYVAGDRHEEWLTACEVVPKSEHVAQWRLVPVLPDRRFRELFTIETEEMP